MSAPLLLTGLLFAQTPAAPEPPAAPPAVEAPAIPTLDETDALLVENYILRLQALQAEMDRRRQAIEARISAKYPGWRMDWQTGRLVRPEPTPEAPR